MPTLVNTDFEPKGPTVFVTDDTALRGGWQIVPNTTARDAIPTARRKQGMIAFVQANNTPYQLSADLLTWVPLGTSGGVITTSSITLVPTSPSVRKVIFVRPTGNDVTGDGTSPSTAFRTLQHALNTIPTFQLGVRYIVDVTGINDTVLSAIVVPPYINSDPVAINFAPPLSPAFLFEGYVTVQAQPSVLATLNAGTTTLSNDPVSGLVVLTDTSQSWTPDQWKGKFVVGSGFFEDGVVRHNTATQLFLSSTSFSFTAPVTINDVGATFTGTPGDTTIRMSGVRATFSLQGIKITHPTAGAQVIFVQACDDIRMTLVDTKEISINSGFSFTTEGCYLHGENSGVVTDWILDCALIAMSDTYFQDSSPSASGNSWSFSGCSIDNCRLLDTGGSIGIVLDLSFVEMLTQGLVLMGTSCSARLFNFRADNCIPVAHINPNGSGIEVEGGAALTLSEGSIGGAGNAGYGIEIDSGGTVWMESTEPVTTTIAGTLGELKVGQRAVRTWTDFFNNHPITTEVDIFSASAFNVNNDTQVDPLMSIFPPYSAGTRPSAVGLKQGVVIYNMTTFALNIADGAGNWRDALGTIV